MQDFKGKKGPGRPVILESHLSAGGKSRDKARKRAAASKRMASVIAKPLNWMAKDGS